MRISFFKSYQSKVPLDPDEIFADSVSAITARANPEGKLERPLERITSVLFLVVIGVGFAYLASRAAALGILSGEKFFKKSQENRFFIRAIYPPRGVVMDRFGKVLGDNVHSFGLALDREAFRQKKGNLPELLLSLAVLLNKPPEYFFELGFPERGDAALLPPRLVISEDLPREAVVALEANAGDFPGVEVFETYRRVYQDPIANAHLVGFVGKVSPEDVERRPELKGELTVGKSGVEATYDSALRGKKGKKIVEVDSRGVESRFRATQEAKEGLRLGLTVDGELQRFAYTTLERYTGRRTGASVVAIDPRNGELLTLVSFPGFDSNRFGSSLSRREFDAILEDSLKPLFNRAISGEFPSGSTIKPVIATAALEEHIIDPEKKIYDEGFIEIPNPYRPAEPAVFLDWRKHGWVNFYDALAVSANVYFYMIGGGYREQEGLGIDRIGHYARAFGLGSRLGVDLPGEKPGAVPDPESKKRAEPNDPVWRVGDTYNVSIGQGGVEVTPLQMAVLTAAIANGGKLWQPHVLDAVLDGEGRVLERHTPRLIGERPASPQSLAQVARGMRQAVTAGTARLLESVPVAVAAKTGTAQAGTGRRPHAWVTAFAPLENPVLALVVMVEHAGEGSTVAMPITKEILDWYFTHRMDQQ